MLTIQEIADSVANASMEYPLRKVELFGSYASGKSTAQSDLLVEFSQPWEIVQWNSNRMKCRCAL